MLEEAADAERARLADRGLAFELVLPREALPVRGDARRLGQLARNLLENSLRYTDSGGPVRLTGRRTRERCELVLDDGPPGVDAEARGRLFDRFFRAEGSRSRDTGGAGLGLAICAEIARAHGGDIAAEASPLGGLRVTVDLPAADAAGREAQA